MGCASSADTTVVRHITSEDCARVPGDEECSRKRDLPARFIARMHKDVGDRIGASLGNTPTGAVIFSVQEGGLFDKWNKANPNTVFYPGFIIEDVNGVQGYWNLLDVMRKPGPLVVRVATVPPASAGPGWFETIASMAKTMEQASNKGPFMLRLPSQDPNSKDKHSFSTMPTVKASDCGVDQCAVCLEDVERHESLVQLPCKHAFHALCAARWLTQSTHKASRCPLCCRRMVSTPEGGVSAIGVTDGCNGH